MNVAGQMGNEVSMLDRMLLIRAYEEKVAELPKSGAAGTCTSVGQEASAVGVVVGARRRRPHPDEPPQRRAPARARRRPGPDDRRGHGPEHRLLQGQERNAAHLRQGAGRDPHLDDRRRRAVARHRRRRSRYRCSTSPASSPASSATARRARASSTSRSTSPPSGSCPSSSSARTTSGRPSCIAGSDGRGARRRPAAGYGIEGARRRRQRRRGRASAAAPRGGRADPRDRQAVSPRDHDLPPARPLRARRPGVRRSERSSPPGARVIRSACCEQRLLADGPGRAGATSHQMDAAAPARASMPRLRSPSTPRSRPPTELVTDVYA